MAIELDRVELELLTQVVEARLQDYSEQIASADDSAFREQLRQERDALQAILQKIRAG